MVQRMNGDTVRDESQCEKRAAPDTHVSSQVSKNRVELGRLEVDEGEIRYIENSFWVTLSNEVMTPLLWYSDDLRHVVMIPLLTCC